MCRKLQTELAQGVMQAGLHRADRDLHDLRDLREVQTVQVVEENDDLVLGPQRVDAL